MIVKWVPGSLETELSPSGNPDTSTRLYESGDEGAFIAIDLFCST